MFDGIDGFGSIGLDSLSFHPLDSSWSHGYRVGAEARAKRIIKAHQIGLLENKAIFEAISEIKGDNSFR